MSKLQDLNYISFLYMQKHILLYISMLSLSLASCNNYSCNDPTAINYQDPDDIICEYVGHASFFISEQTFNSLKGIISDELDHHAVYIGLWVQSNEGYVQREYISIYKWSEWSSLNTKTISECPQDFNISGYGNRYNNEMYGSWGMYENGRIVNAYCQVKFHEEIIGVIWEGDLVFNPSEDLCFITELHYE